MPPISVLIKPASGMCNMSCEYCFYYDETKKREQESFGFMSEETLKNVIRKTMLRAEGRITYAFQGRAYITWNRVLSARQWSFKKI